MMMMMVMMIEVCLSMEQPTTEPLTAFLVTHEASDSIQNSCIEYLLIQLRQWS